MCFLIISGCGKTTLLSQLSLDFAEQNVPVLWGSFEIKNVRLLQKMLLQYYGRRTGAAGSLHALTPSQLDDVSVLMDDVMSVSVCMFVVHA